MPHSQRAPSAPDNPEYAEFGFIEGRNRVLYGGLLFFMTISLSFVAHLYLQQSAYYLLNSGAAIYEVNVFGCLTSVEISEGSSGTFEVAWARGERRG